jgi:hypothetical protein
VRKVAIWAVGVLAAASLVAGVGPSSLADAAVNSAAPAAAPAAAEAAAELAGDITFSVPSGTFQTTLSVGLSTTVAGAEIRYTTDGQLPTATSPAYAGTPLQLTTTTQLRAQAFVGGAATGAPGTAVYIARAIDASHDMPVLVMDAYGQGKPGREYVDTAFMEFQPVAGSTSLSAKPTVATRAGIHLRGQSSATFAKAPYRVELWDNAGDDADYPLLGMPADSDWVLRGPFTDKALIRDAFTYELGRDIGMQAPRFAFAEVYLNVDNAALGADDYQGVYMLVETIKNSKNRLDLEKLKEDDVALPDISGGYIFKFDWMAAEEPILECTGTAATCWQYLEVVDPSPVNAQQEAWLTEYLRQFHEVLRAPNFADPQTGYRSFIDVRSFVDQLIINELSREMDSYIRSAYFHKDRDGKLFAGPLWDYDLAYGVGGFFNNTSISGWQYEQTRNPIANDWFNRLLEDPAFVADVRTRWQELRRGPLSDAQMNARIDALTAPLANGAARNFQKWPNLSTRQIGFFQTPVAPTWQGQVDVMRTWLRDRSAWLDTEGGWGAAG